MAIFNAGKRVGPFDIRLGLSRDKSLQNVDRDPRLQVRANSENTIGRFRASMAKAEGYARPARYFIRIFLPSNLEKMAGILPDPGKGGGGNRAVSPDAVTMHHMATEYGSQINLHCDSITMPSHDLQTTEITTYGPPRQMVTGHGFTGTIAASFYADKFMRERSYFELWQKAAMSTSSTFNTNYYDNYVANLNIFQLGQFASRQERDDITYGVQLIDCFPTKIGAVDYSHDANNVQTIDVDFSFRYWINYFIDKQGNIELGSPLGRIPEIKNNKGIFGSLINKLPPELRRAGRDVLNDLRRRVPLGRVTGGRVFPPFKIPPLNI